jgi:hypothetical protein
MSNVVYRSEIHIDRIRGPIRKARIPGEADPVTFGVHGAIAEHYKVSPEAFPPQATTIDYVIASTGG